MIMRMRRRLLQLPPATSTPPHVPRTHPRCKHESVGRFYTLNPTLAPNASRWGYLLNPFVTTHPGPHPRSKSESVGSFLEFIHATTHPGPHPRSKSESVESFFVTIHATTHLDPTLAPKASRWGYFLNPFARQTYRRATTTGMGPNDASR
jgi:hypothetical protein